MCVNYYFFCLHPKDPLFTGLIGEGVVEKGGVEVFWRAFAGEAAGYDLQRSEQVLVDEGFGQGLRFAGGGGFVEVEAGDEVSAGFEDAEEFATGLLEMVHMVDGIEGKDDVDEI